MTGLYNAGDVVRIRHDLEVGRLYGNLLFIDDMKDMLGKNVTISKCLGFNTYFVAGSLYRINGKMIEKKISSKSDMEIREYGEKEKFTANIEIEIVKVIYNNPATIMFYKARGSNEVKKIVSKAMPTDIYYKDKGLHVCLLKAHIKECKNELSKY
ncbi:hypothetical protein M5X17_27980 [Paenibacillus alvei]|uniref:hypothetical protein n=1 Tax=Paenibacillus alvei TaxID=44250 RepID=UPI002280A23D|nr:hypothetical protein [Paenibacillus alvei]MCY9737547.1 hypothetical protein [Paenibacillus alvei]